MYEDLTGCRLDKTVEHPYERRFTTAGETHNDEDFTLLNIEIDAIDTDCDLFFFGKLLFGIALLQESNALLLIRSEQFNHIFDF
ncbi:hypothetical protein D3C72_2265420 [compost metagenome]